jgi:hypothetical protein
MRYLEEASVFDQENRRALPKEIFSSYVMEWSENIGWYHHYELRSTVCRFSLINFYFQSIAPQHASHERRMIAQQK